MVRVDKIIGTVQLPRMVPAAQHFQRDAVPDIADALARELARPAIRNTVQADMRIAITCGSRGIANLALILREIVRFCQAQGARPFIIPAMGSHGGAMASGQKEICASLGVTESFCGCPIEATMEVVRIGTTSEGHPVMIDRFAAAADGIIVVNRIKSHTSFVGPYESGLMKMIAIGLGKHQGATACHQAGFSQMARLVPLFAETSMENCNICFGVGLIENAYDETSEMHALLPEEIVKEEPLLLQRAKQKMARLLPGSADVLIVDYIGKNISGTGMDPNIIGRATTKEKNDPNFFPKRIVVLDITEETAGCIVGVGLADMINKRVFEKADLYATYANSITSTALNGSFIPLMLDNDREAICCAIKTAAGADQDKPRIVRIQNTLEIAEIWISEPMLREAGDIAGLTVTGPPEQWTFNAEGNLW